MPRTKITEEQILDQAFVTETELNDFFNTVVITGTEDATQVIQTFDQYFPGRGLVAAGNGITIATGTNFVQINSPGAVSPNAIVGDSFISVVSGVNTTNLLADAIISGNNQITVSSGTNAVSIFGRVPEAIVGGADISVVSGTGFIRITDNNRAIISNNNNELTITSGTNTITFSPIVDKAIVGDDFISVVTGTNTINLLADAIVGIPSNMTVISGTSTVTVSGVVTVTSGIAYINDSTRGGKSLSVYRTPYTFGFEGNADNAYLKVGVVANTNVGIPIFRAATITAISAFYPTGAASKDFEIRRNGVATSLRTFTVTLATSFTADSENINLNPGDYLQVFAVAAGNAASDPVVSVEVAWRLV